jgi:hypothetical protein
MIKFRPKTLEEDLMPEAIKRLDDERIGYNKISLDEADKTSKLNSKAMVLLSFIKTGKGYYQIKLQSKEVYGYVKKLLTEKFRMRITDIDTSKRIITAETDFIGIALDIIEILGLNPHFNLSLVYDKI